jgi:hypothetical protein
MPFMHDGVLFYTEEEALKRAHDKIERDAIAVAARYRKTENSQSPLISAQ